jgi:thiol-disulfide isomerase/thioredoxin
MKTYIIIIGLMLSTTLAYTQKVSNFELKDIDNKSRTFNELKGKKLTLIDFWATWCKPCTKAIPELNKIYEMYRDKGVEIIGINGDGPRSVSKVAPVSKALKIKYPVLIDLNASVKADLNVIVFPTLLIVNTEGNVVWVHEGFVTGDTEVIIAEIEKYLK